ncbi:ABC transporter ATP-binding protein [Paracoccus shanxieyensis]|uniref:ATP-binding cassette domain-containing protein n=1 Tax=Paracoccus shanxieyensis TaxID=2675752 RepID=A0A6L6IWD4_9RHOB|nr:ATP-binding cassette domain-containing protein [Paracoccus shanxieyensis]MTH64209.1 ATP-binding cassette domain-containing protein [Paracoccus shanxieyensis]MTH87353.1 ATP-binding cassette domain-containing protein [Paracoccus shanxieyensis]
MTQPLFTIKGLCVDVPGRRLIHDLDLALPGGQVIALIGHNGSSKSTLLKVLARQIGHSLGEVRFAGRPISDYNAQDYARGLAFMPQTTPPAEGMTVRELVALGRYPWHGALGRFGPDDHAAVEGAMQECGVTEFAGQLVDTLSGGERQRCWLAMMVAQAAGTLLLDEPISALDIAHQVEVLSLVRRMCHNQGRTAIVVLHEVNMAARFCDHVVAMKAGRLALQGSPDDLMRPEALEHVYGLPMQVLRREDGGRVAVPA